jgi:hypothetical protein
LEYLEKRKNELLKPFKIKDKQSFSHKQIAIAYCILREPITKENASLILTKYSTNKSVKKLLDMRYSNVSELTKVSDHKATNTLHLKDLEAAKRLLSSGKNKEAIKSITRVISTFQSNLNTNS